MKIIKKGRTMKRVLAILGIVSLLAIPAYASNFTNLEVDISDTTAEYTQAVGEAHAPAKRIFVQNRAAQTARLSFQEYGTTDTENYYTIKSGAVWDSGPVEFNGNLYLRDTNGTGSAIEVIYEY